LLSSEEKLLQEQEECEKFLNEEESKINQLIKPFKSAKAKLQKELGPMQDEKYQLTDKLDKIKESIEHIVSNNKELLNQHAQ